MKKILFVLALGALFAACSSPKYTYYFDRYTTKSKTTLTEVKAEPKNGEANDIGSEKSSTVTSGAIGANSSAPIQEETLVASTSKEIPVQPTKKTSLADNGPATTLFKTTKTDRKELLKALKEFRAIKKAFPASVQEGDKSKNAFAVVGFISVILSLLVGLLSIPLASTILWILGLAFCIVGLKSEQRYLAKAGIIILGVLFLIGLIVLIAVLAAVGSGAL